MHAFVPRGIASLQVTGFVLIAASLSPLFAADDSKTPPRNVVIFITDDQSPDLGCYGNTAIKTPHMDALATEGVRFPYAFCTTASCSASRSVVLTGLHNHANGHYGHQHSYHKFSSFPWVQSLPVILSRAGYRTARIGKHHNAPEEVYYFETKLPGSGRSPVEMAENCREWIEQSGEQPFFLYFATADPHRSGNIAEDLPYRPNRFGNKPNGESYPFVEEILYEPADVIVPPFLPETQSTRAELAQYYQSISRIDQGLGRLVQILKETGQWDQTLFLFTSDHGMAFAGAKTTVYEGGLRVPFILRNPDMKQQGTDNQAMVSFVDIVPTVLDWAGLFEGETQTAELNMTASDRKNAPTKIPEPYRLQGRSILPILHEAEPKDWDVVYASHTFHEIQMYYPMRVVRDREWKLIWNIAHPLPFPFASDLWAAPSWQAQYEIGLEAPYGRCTVHDYIHRPEFELYRIDEDPHETTNLASETTYADVLKAYQAKLKTFQEATDDPWVMKWDYE